MPKLMRYIWFFLIVAIGLSPLLSYKEAAEAQDDALKLWIASDVPDDYTAMLQPLLDTEEYRWVNEPDDAEILVTINDPDAVVTSQWLYVPVTSFASTPDRIRAFHIEQFWNGSPQVLDEFMVVGDDTLPTLYLTAEVYDALVAIWDVPNEDSPIEVVPPDALSTLLWENRPFAWSILAFNDLRPEFKALKVNQTDIFAADFQIENYPLMVPIGISGDDRAVGHLAEDLLDTGLWQPSNREDSKLTRVVLSGVTAMVRATAHQMEEKGLTYPANGIMDFIDDADIMHTSNEVSFSENCPPADRFQGTTIFCSDDRYLELLTHIGLDVVELTGNHNLDYGPGAFRHTYEIYQQNNIATFGGGLTPEDARDAYITEHNGNTIAFIGCNVPGPFKALASTERPGAAPCDDEFLSEELPRLAQEVDIVIMTVQQWEFYRYSVGQEQVRQFTQFANWGADIVIGSQAHQPQGFGFVPREGETPAFLHHGLGNLFFDQMAEIGTRQMFMDKLIIYDGQLLSVDLYTGLLEEWCCARPMTETERVDFLNTIFAASGW